MRWFLSSAPGDEPALCDLQDDPALDIAMLEPRENVVDRIQRLRLDGGLDATAGREFERSSISLRVPTIEPRMVSALSTTSKIGVGKSPGGSPTSETVPPRRSIPIA